MKKNEFRSEMPWQVSTATEKQLNDVYNIMKSCWDILPENRPKFYNLQVDLDHFEMTGDLIGYDLISSEAEVKHDQNRQNHPAVKPGRTFSIRVKNPPISSLIN